MGRHHYRVGASPSGSASFLDWPIVIMAAGWLFSVPPYLSMFVAPAVTPVICGVATIALVAGRLLTSWDVAGRVSLSLPVWILGLAILDLCWFAVGGQGQTFIIGPRLLFLALMLALYLAFSAAPDLRERLLGVLFTGSLLSVPMLFYDVTHPFTFVPADSEFATLGRAAGLFINPNSAAATLCVVLFLCFWRIRSSWRWLYLAWMLCGILLTGSRGALVCVPFVFMVMALMGRITAGDTMKFLLVLVVLAICGYLALPLVADYIGIQPDFIFQRVLAVLQPDQGTDFSSSERQYLAARGLQEFLYSPIYGNGVGSTEWWTERSSTHNMFVQLMSDFGVAGAVVLPMLLIMALSGVGVGSVGSARIAATTFFVAWGLFSHNLLNTEYYFMVALSLVFASHEGQERLTQDVAIPGCPVRVV